jgi:hypothetical protein
MKNNNFSLTLLVLFAFAGIIFGSCKKGENDPAISFKSRDARITAKWKLTKIASTYTQVEGPSTTLTLVSFDGFLYTTKISVNGNPVITDTKSGTFEMTIEKEGVMSWNETYINGGTTEARYATGFWRWLDSDKNKSWIYVEGGAYFFFSGRYKIDRLASKELVFIEAGNSYNNGITQDWKKTITFERE